MTEKAINHELVKLTKRPPRTTAEKNFHEWLLSWKDKMMANMNIERRRGGDRRQNA